MWLYIQVHYDLNKNTIPANIYPLTEIVIHSILKGNCEIGRNLSVSGNSRELGGDGADIPTYNVWIPYIYVYM